MRQGEDWASAQRWLMAALTEPPEDADRHLVGTEIFAAVRGLAVYQNAYWLRLIGCLAETFWATHRALGEEAFNALALAYLQAQPPKGPNLNTLGEGFADHLEATCPPDAAPSASSLIDLVRYEWVVDRVFDGPGAEGTTGIDHEALSQLGPEAWVASALAPHPALRLVRLSSPVDTYVAELRGLSEGDPAPPLPALSARFLAFSRRDYRVRVLVCEAEEWALLGRLSSGVVIGEAFEHLAGGTSPEQIEGWFARWMAEDLFVGLEHT